MNLNIPSLGNLFPLEDSLVECDFVVDGKTYPVEHFQVQFEQEVDHKRQPQHETRGGQFSIILTQAVEYNILRWAKKSEERKSGSILFKKSTSGTVLRIEFVNAYCVALKHRTNHQTGTRTTLVIAPEKISLNGTTHDNRWRE